MTTLTPNPVAVSQWAALTHSLLAALGGAGVIGGVWASISVEQINTFITGGITIVGGLMAAWAAFLQWRREANAAKEKRLAEVSAAVASARATLKAGEVTPVTVTVTPARMANVATLVSPSEAAAAPSVPVNVAPSPAPLFMPVVELKF